MGRIEATKLEPETEFEKNIDDIKAYHMKSTKSLDMNLSAINPNEPSLYSEHLNTDIIS